MVDGGELVIERGQGAVVYDADGRRYLDATASLWYCNVGHGRQAIAAAVAAQLGRLAAYSTPRPSRTSSPRSGPSGWRRSSASR